MYNSVSGTKQPTFGLFMLLNCYKGIQNTTHDAHDTENFLMYLLLLSDQAWFDGAENNVLHLLLLQSVSTEDQ